MNGQQITGSLQENILTLLVFDTEAIQIISNAVSVELFESQVYRDIASQAINYYNSYKEPIGTHLPDVFEHVLNGKDASKAKYYADTFKNLYELQDCVNKKYVLDQLAKFVRQQNLKLGIKEAVELIQSDKLDEAEQALEKSKKKVLSVFDVGANLKDINRSLNFLNNIDSRYHHIGIEHFDKYNVCPAPKELFLFTGPPNAGKSWFLTHVAKQSLLQRKSVLHITLEMSEEIVLMRYMQSLFAITKNQVPTEQLCIKKDNYGSFADFSIEKLPKIKSFQDNRIEKYLTNKLELLRNTRLTIKEFPTGQLTVQMLRGYLDNFYSVNKYIPDILLIDYPDLMYKNSDRIRTDTGQIYIDLRGIATEYNLALITPSQCNRVGKSAKLLTSEFLAEDFSKIMTADTHITYNQTAEEYQLGLARLYVDKHRNERKGDIVLITQNYAIGQFALQSALINNRYQEVLKNYV